MTNGLHRAATALAACAATFAAGATRAAELPVPCVAGACGSSVTAFVTSGQASAAQSGNTLTVTQSTGNATLNWRSFNISSDGTVTFQQPDAASIALNQIFQADPSRIFGALNADGRVFLINQNGILFGETARVNVGGLVASSLQASQSAIDNGIAQAVRENQAAFAEFRAADGTALPSGPITIERGARLLAQGGQILVFAPEVTNRGEIRTPDGQAILAAGQQIYLLASSDSDLRGLLVEVNGGGTVTNGDVANEQVTRPEDLVGRIIAERGNVTLAGLAVNQSGRVSATTSVRFNGSIRLQAQNTVDLSEGTPARPVIRSTRGGVATLGAGSVTEVGLDVADTATAVDLNAQPRSRVEVSGDQVRVLERSRITATSGSIEVSAQTNPRFPITESNQPVSTSRVYVAAGARVDVSGAALELPMERNVIEAQLRANEVRDSPEQREGALRGQTVRIDVRRSGTRTDGTRWEGTPLADVSGQIDNIQRTVVERNLTGGTVLIQSQGDVLLAPGATIDVSGGSVRYRDGYINTSRVVSNGRVFDVADADPSRTYQGIVDTYTETNPVWGITRTFPGFPSLGTFTPGYIEGKDAGSISIVGPRLVLDSGFVGTVAQGERQRETTQSFTAGARAYRPSEQIPLAGRLVIGRAPLSAPLTPDVRFAPGAVFPTLTGPGGDSFDPLTGALPDALTEVRIRPDVLGPRAMGTLRVRSEGRITVPEDVVLTPAAGGGELQLSGAVVDFAGSVLSPGSSVLFAGGAGAVEEEDETTVRVAGTARIDVSGRWINDAESDRTRATRTPLLTNGGSVRLEVSRGVMEIERGSVIDVSGGALRRSDGRINVGGAGAIAIADTARAIDPGTVIRADGELRGYSLGRGASLSLSAGAVCIASAGCAADDGSVLAIRPELFSTGGFASYSLTATRGSLDVLPGTVIAPRLTSLEVTRDTTLILSGTPIESFTRLATLADDVRSPVNLSLRVGASSGTGGAVFNQATFGAAPRLEIGRGALLNMDVGANLSLRTSTSMIVDGTTSAPAGRISLELDSTLALDEFIPAQAIWLTSSGRLLAPGVSRLRINDAGRREGSVLGGGSVNIRAIRGYFLADPASVIDVSGTDAEIDIRESLASGTYGRQQVGSAGGLIDIFAAEGAQLAGELRGRAGRGSVEPVGGELRLSIDPRSRADVTIIDPATNLPISIFPGAPRTILLSAEAPRVVVGPEVAVPDSLNGIVHLGASTVERGGFSSLSLLARNVLEANAVDVRGTGRILAEGDVALHVPARLILDVPRIEGSGGSLSLSAGSYLALGSSDAQNQFSGEALGGTSRLTLGAGFVDLIGTSTLSGFESIDIDSAADIRGRGIQLSGARELRGSLTAAGDLTLRAAQVYPATLTSFRMNLSEADRTLRIASNTAARQPVLSAAGQLSLQAPRIVSSGALLAPFGSIELSADEVLLDSGSLTSVSGAGLAIPFGFTQGGFDWVYELDQQTLVFGSGEAQIPLRERRVALVGDRLELASGSTIDLAGGGELFASEFVPGVDGTRDVLSPVVSPNAFAIVPSLGLDYAPYDRRLYAESSIQPGETLTIGAGGAVPAGTYAVLPARYALLPGAYLVSAVSGYTDLALGESAPQLDGTMVVGGFRGIAGTPLRDARTSGFLLRTRADLDLLARYTTTSASTFFAQQADALGVARPRLPVDAGLLSLNATGALSLEGALRASAVGSGRGAEVDVSSERILVVPASTAAAGSAAADGAVVVSAEGLTRLGAESILIGGSRQRTREGLTLTTSADSVTLGDGARIEAPELLFAAREELTFEAGAQAVTPLRDEATLDEERVQIQVRGDGAFARVAAGAQVDFERTEASGTAGDLDFRAGALIQSSGAILFDASGSSRLDGDLNARDASLSLSAARVLFGAADADDALVLAPAEIEALGLRELELASRSTIDFSGSINLELQRVSLTTAGLRALDSGTSVSIGAREMRLGGAQPASAPSLQTGTGVLSLRAETIELASGQLQLSGFERSVLDAAGVLSLDGIDLLAAGDLQLASERLTGLRGASSAVTAAGRLAISGTTQPAPAQPAVLTDSDVLGSRVRFSGSSIEHGGRIELPSGVLSFEATGAGGPGVVFRDESLTDLSGRTIDFDGERVASDDGRLSVSALSGDIDVAAGARISVAASPDGGAAGSLAFAVPDGNLRLLGSLDGTAASAGAGGTVRIDARNVGDFADLNRRLNAGGFDAERRFRIRGEGPVVVGGSGDAAVRASTVVIVADRGRVDVTGAIDAGEGRGRVTLAARDGVSITGHIDADGESGGSIDVMTQTGGIDVAPGSQIALDDGALRLRLPRESILSLLDDAVDDGLRIAGSISGASRLDVEGFAAYLDADGTVSAAEVAAEATNPRWTEAQAFAANTAQIRSALGRPDDPAFHLLAGVEVRATGDLALASDWNLFPWRFDGEPGVLSLRAAGDLVFDRSLSDGFAAITGATAFVLPIDPGDSWSYRLTAGADLASADLLAVLGLDELPANRGNFRISPGTASTNPLVPSTFRMVRTGRGRIDVAAGRDFVLGDRNNPLLPGNRVAVLYTAGAASSGGVALGALGSRAYPEHGGDISIFAQGDLIGARSNQLVTDWLWRAGRPSSGTGASATGWTVNYQRFEQGIGALGGGDVTVHVGGNTRDLSVSIPSIGRQVGSRTPDTSTVQVIGGGNLRVDVGGTLSGGSFYAGLGHATIRADEIARSGSGTQAFFPILALGDAAFRVTARRDAGLEAIVNPTLVPQGRSQPNLLLNRSYFSTYSADSRVELTSAAGDVTLAGNRRTLAQVYTSLAFSGIGLAGLDDSFSLRLFPPSLRAAAVTGDFRVLSGFTLFPSPRGNLELFAGGDLLFSPQTAEDVILSDADPSFLPSVAAPQSVYTRIQEVTTNAGSRSPNFHARIPVHAPVPGAGVSRPVRIVAREGDIRVDAPSNVTTRLFTSKETRIVAGRDIVDLHLLGQNVRATDVTSVIAGRDVVYRSQRDDAGTIQANIREMILAGPGRLEVRARRNIDLQTARGITTTGNLDNPALAQSGATVSLAAGLGSQGAQYAGFIDKYLAGRAAYDSRLLDYTSALAGRTVTSKSEALQILRGAPVSKQAALIEETLYAEIRTSGRAAADSGSRDLSRAFEAIDTLFPGSSPAQAADDANPYAGDISLYFSRVYTLDGGDVSLLAPGGGVNAGLATPPAAFGITKAASELGVVAQSTGDINAFASGDFLVNESRVFAADGGNILIWSTQGDIDAGRGAKTAISAPPPTITIDDDGRTVVTFPAALAGSGIQTLATSPGREAGDVDLFAPGGVINAGDAGIRCRRCTFIAPVISNLSNITSQFTSGFSLTQAPLVTPNLSTAASSATSASGAAEASLGSGAGEKSAAPLAEEALGWLDVFVEGFGDDVCKANDAECLKRNARD